MAKLFKRFLLAASILVVAFIAYYGYSFIQFGLGIQDKPEAETPEIQTPLDKDTDNRKPSESEEPTLPEWEGSERVNILLLGGDARDVSAGRTDTILVLSIDPVSKQTSLFYFRRAYSYTIL